VTQPISQICRAFALSLLVAGAAGPGWAAPAAGGGEAEVDRLLRIVVEEAKAKVNSDDYEGALRVLVDAYDRAPHPALLWPIAELYLQLQRPNQGLKILDRYVMLVPTNKMPAGQRLPEVDKMREQFRTMLSQLTITADEPGASVLVDGKPAGQVPLAAPLQLDPGQHRIELQVGRSSFKEVLLKPGETGKLHLVLSSELTAEPPPAMLRRRPVRTAALVLGGIGLGGVVAGAVLWGLDGQQSCAAAPLCPTALDTKTLGIGVLAGGLGLSLASAVLLGIEPRQKP
jgi:hypothetical protein